MRDVSLKLPQSLAFHSAALHSSQASKLSLLLIFTVSNASQLSVLSLAFANVYQRYRSPPAGMVAIAPFFS
jgi:hypothetical protein